MAIPLNGHFRIVVNQTLFGQQVKNVLHYRVQSVPITDAAGVAQAWWDKHKATWRAAVGIPLTTYRIDLFDNDDPLGIFGSYTVPVAEQPGTNGNDVYQTFAAWPFIFSVPTRLTKPGSMRLAGVRTSDLTSDGAPIAAALTKLNALAAKLAAGFNYDLLDAGIAKLAVYGAPHPPSSRYPARVAAEYQDVSAVTLGPRCSTQNTRKVGRGA